MGSRMLPKVSPPSPDVRPAAQLLTTNEVAALLRVHPKHVYRLLKRGLPANRVGDEWRFDEAEVLAWSRGARPAAPAPAAVAAGSAPAPLLAANGDLAVDALFAEARERGAPMLGFVQADHGTGLALLGRDAVLGAGCHGDGAPASSLAGKVVRVHLAVRELGLAHRRGMRLRRPSGIVGRRLAARPPTAGIRRHLDEALCREGIELERVYARAILHASHREAVMAVVRGDAEVALASRAWAAHAGLGFTSLATEAYGLALRAEHLGDPRVIALCELAQGASYRSRLAHCAGYDAQRAGEIRVQ
jgi:putative molybdopterin biosynthesis protein